VVGWGGEGAGLRRTQRGRWRDERKKKRRGEERWCASTMQEKGICK